MKTKVCKVILMFVLVMGFGLCMLNGEEHCWKFDETSGDIAQDSCGNVEVNGRLMGCAAFLPAGEGVHLNGSSDSFVSFGTNVGQFGTKDFTVYLSFKTVDINGWADILGNKTSDSDNKNFVINMSGNGSIYVALVDGEKLIYFTSKKSGLDDGNWHSLVVNRIGKTLSLYIDGRMDSTKENEIGAIADIKNGNEFRLGLSLGKVGAFTPNAVYKNLLVFDRVVPLEEINALFKK